MCVYDTDKPHDPNSRTQPRTEVHMNVLDYTSGASQFETSGVTVAQLHGAAEDASTSILRVYDGNLRYYSGDLVATGLYDRWFRLNIIHDVDGDWATVDVDGEQKYSTKGRGPGDLHFKCGVYAAPRDITYYMESRASGPRHFIRSLAILRLWFWDRYNSGDLVATDLYDRRFRRNITHYMDEG
ncbi:hypothetical protein POTOM_007620 [Populus tomentosa]|uniref:Alginate lyase 2 domain-containing protein n=1 Tax=Populus tomentosa TaxID=118781 RepID=A0A8X8AAH3_POPTO|nr:hypothetical protein POTOM_007620 [Populus tomentosa]